MSGRLVSAVFESALPAWLKPYAAAFATFAADDGSRVYPGVARVARMVGHTDRAVQTAVTELQRRGVLVLEAPRRRGSSARYRFDLTVLAQLGTHNQRILFEVPRYAQADRKKCSGK